jgi:sugar diacid utilization regulator
VVDSYDDARLAVRTIRRQSGAGAVLAYEDFGFAMRLVSDVGTEKMGTWAEQLLGPLDGQPLLLEGLREYFDSQLNIIAAAKNLNVHHNSLRYRLSRVEELLQVKLRDPATVTALFLALTARALDDESPDTRRPAPLRRPRSPGAQPPEDRSPGVVTDPREPGQPEHLGAAVGPDR